MQAIIKAVVGWLLSFVFGSLFGRKSSDKKRADKVIEDYRAGEKIDAQPKLTDDSLRAWFKRLRR